MLKYIAVLIIIAQVVSAKSYVFTLTNSAPGVYTAIINNGEYCIGQCAPSADPWTPSNTTTTLWFDGADDGTVTESGGAISQWDDKSGNSRNATQSTAANQATYTTLGGLPVVSLDANDYFNVGYNPSGNLSVYVVVANDRASLVASQADIVLANTYGGNPGMSVQTYNGYTTTSKRSYYSVGNSATLYLDGVVTTDGASTLTYQHPYICEAVGNFPTGQGNMKIGRTQNGNQYGNNLIHEIVFVSGQDSESDRQKMEGYLAHKWGFEDDLPAGHPYKSAAPTQ